MSYEHAFCLEYVTVDLQHLEGKLDDLLDRGVGFVPEDGLDGLGDGSWREAEHLEGFAGFVVDLAVLERRSIAVAGWRCRLKAEGNNLVAELDNDALGGLGAEALDGLEHALIALHDQRGQFGGGEAAEHGAGGVAAYAADTDEHEEELALLLGGKAKERPCVFADGLVDKESRLALSLQSGVGVEGDVEQVTHAMCLDGGLGGSEFVEDASDVFNHFLFTILRFTIYFFIC